MDDMAGVDDGLEDSDDSFSDGDLESWEEYNLGSMHVLYELVQLLILLSEMRVQLPLSTKKNSKLMQPLKQKRLFRWLHTIDARTNCPVPKRIRPIQRSGAVRSVQL